MSTKKNPILNTDIKELDELLGIKTKGFEPGSIIIIKGGPGSGKTTLGLQILKKHLEKNDLSDHSENIKYCTALISLETPVINLLNHVNDHYSFNLTSSNPSFNKYFYSASREDIEMKLAECFTKELHIDPNEAIKLSLENQIMKDAKNNSSNDRNKKIESFKDHENDNSYNIVFIDNLNILVDIIRSQSSYDLDLRKTIHYICGTITDDIITFNHLKSVDKVKNTIYIFAVEFHSEYKDNNSLISESFFCDTEILLNLEPLYGHPRKAVNELSNVGYNIEIDSQSNKTSESRSFCRVLKSRYSKNQSRRCLYDTVEKEGIKFFETFPGDGEINLFAENKPQRKHWDDFIKHDMKFSYPALRYNTFNRNSLQRTFISFRQFKHIPEKTDMYLTSFDNYWINWYTDQRREWFIEENVKKYIEKDSVDFKDIVSKIHKELTKNKLDVNEVKFIISNVLKLKVFKNTLKNENKLPEIIFKNEIENILNKRIFDMLAESEFFLCFECNYVALLLENLHINLSEVAEPFFSTEIKLIAAKTKMNNKEWLEKEVEKEVISLRKKYRNTDIIPIVNSLNKLFIIISEIKCDYINIFLTKKYYKLIEITINKINKEIEHVKNPVNNSKLNLSIEEKRKYIKSLEIEIKHLETEKTKMKTVFEKSKKSSNINIDDKIEEKHFCKYCFIKNNLIEELESIIKKINEEVSKGFDILYNGRSYNRRIEISFNVWEFKDLLFDYYSKLLKKLFYIRTLHSFKNQHETGRHRMILILSGLISAYYGLWHKDKSAALLKEIPNNKIKLFGERDSQIIKELDDFKFSENRPVHYASRLFSMRNKESYISIPYNANIGFIVFRKELLEKIYKHIDQNEYKKNLKNIVQWEIEAILSILKLNKERNNSQKDYEKFDISLSEYIKTLKKHINIKDLKNINTSELKSKIEKYINNKINVIVDKNYFNNINPPNTWEEIITLCLTKRTNNIHNSLFLIETQIFDTYLATFLEFFWSFGGDLQVYPDYTFKRIHNTASQLFLTFYLIGLMFQNDVIPKNSTIEPKNFKTNNDDKKWLFKRQWHSTFIEFLTSKKINKIIDEGTELDIMPIPTSILNCLFRSDVKHISCWGDWHIAMTNGSENDELGINLINNLMSSRKIAERAFSGAELPTTEIFYKLYNDVKCFNIPNIEQKKLPDKTFRELRKMLFENAKSRTQIFDYRHVMRELHSVLEYVRYGSPNSVENGGDIKCLSLHFVENIFIRLHKAMEKIQSLKFQ